MKREIEAYFFLLQYNIVKSNHPPIPSHSRVSRRHRLLSPKSSHFLFNSSSPATVQKPVNFISHICGLGASVGCERVERTFNAPRLKSQICLIGGNGFVCSSLNELNSKLTYFLKAVMIYYVCLIGQRMKWRSLCISFLYSLVLSNGHSFRQADICPYIPVRPELSLQ